MYEHVIQEFFDFLQQTPSCYHVVDHIRKQLLQANFEELEEGKPWKIAPGKNYFTSRNGSSLIAFRLPKQDFVGFQLVASHSDSPGLKVKEHPEIEAAGNYLKLNVEKYGGLLAATWLDRPLSLAGRVVVREENHFAVRLFDAGRDIALIPNLAIHFDRHANEGKSYQTQVDLLPVLGDANAKGALLRLIAETLQVQEEQILGSDLFLYPRTTPTIWGIQHEYIAAPRLDDLQCTYASLRGFLEAQNPNSVPVFAVFDNEEVGSGTKQGASGTFLKDTLRRIHFACGHSQEDFWRSLASSFMVSADNAHAVHPNHTEKSDLVNRPQLNGGVVIKYHANQKYTTDAVSAAIFKTICERAGVPFQEFHNHSDMAGGSTLGNLSNLQVSLNAVDVGLAQLAMHSSYECAGAKDLAYLAKALQYFYSSTFRSNEWGCLTLDD